MKTTLDQIQISVASGPVTNLNADAIVVVVFKDKKLHPDLEKLDDVLDGQITTWLNHDFVQNDREKGTWIAISNKNVKAQVLLLNAGEQKGFSKNQARDIYGTAAKYCQGRSVKSVTLVDAGIEEMPFETCLEGFLLGSYRFATYRLEKAFQTQVKNITVYGLNDKSSTQLKKQLPRIKTLVRATYLARDLVNEPANVINPESFSKVAQKIAQGEKLSIKILKGADLKKQNMNLLLAVAQGSLNEPCFIHIEYKPKKKAKHSVALVGKGVTFDTGGLSLKPAAAMLGMKMDMAGAASVLCAIWAASVLEIPVHVHALMPMVENMPSGNAIRPGDIVTGRAGKSVEIDNTDAEGRLILADALHYGEDLNVDYMIDVATLTGACVIALGDEIAAMYSTDDHLRDMISSASADVGEKMWAMPLEKNYLSQMKSEIADLKNVGGREGGSITAALFLKEFVSKTKWAHLDIAGPSEAQKDFPTCPKGATGFPVRTFVKFLENLV